MCQQRKARTKQTRVNTDRRDIPNQSWRNMGVSANLTAPSKTGRLCRETGTVLRSQRRHCSGKEKGYSPQCVRRVDLPAHSQFIVASYSERQIFCGDRGCDARPLSPATVHHRPEVHFQLPLSYIRKESRLRCTWQH